MAVPEIVSITPSEVEVSPGVFVDVTIVATDPDSASGSIVFPITDGFGNTTNASLTLSVDDPLTAGEAVNDDGLSVTIAKIFDDGLTFVYRITGDG